MYERSITPKGNPSLGFNIFNN